MGSKMNRKDLSNFIKESCNTITGVFEVKNVDYGSNEDAFANFRKTAERIVQPFMQKHGVRISIEEAMFLVLLVLQDKHLVALSQTGLSGKEVDERLGDVAVYSLIAKAMYKEVKESNKGLDGRS